MENLLKKLKQLREKYKIDKANNCLSCYVKFDIKKIKKQIKNWNKDHETKGKT